MRVEIPRSAGSVADTKASRIQKKNAMFVISVTVTNPMSMPISAAQAARQSALPAFRA